MVDVKTGVGDAGDGSRDAKALHSVCPEWCPKRREKF